MIEVFGKINFFHADCLSIIKLAPDNFYDIAIIDPPYGIGESGSTNASRSKLAVAKDYKPFAGHDKEPPSREYFEHLFRVSKNQIIFGANHFIENLPDGCKNSSCWIIWDKENGASDFADFEMAWTSFDTATRIFRFRWAGMLQGDMKNKETRIHSTQKPVALYRWILDKYAKKGDRVLDTHGGSGSIAIACHYLGFELFFYELDPDYFRAAIERFKQETRQQEFNFDG